MKGFSSIHWHTLACIAATALLFSPATRADIYKCVDGALIAYQSMPCAPGAEQTQMSKSAPAQVARTDASDASGVRSDASRASASSAQPAAPRLPSGTSNMLAGAGRVPPDARPTRRAGPWTHTTLTLGMSDDEVLNMPAWGRPGRIVRTKLPKGWSEEWTYANDAGGEHRLRFVNAKLVGVETAPAAASPVQVAATAVAAERGRY